MYLVSKDGHSARRFVDRPNLLGPQAAASTALARLRKLFTAYRPGMYFDVAQLRSVLAAPLADPAEETERLFALGWLNWLSGDLSAAEVSLHEAVGRADQSKAIDLLAAAAYWRARVRLLLKRTDAVAEYEGVMRKLSGSPQGTAWFVDLLWRAGRVDRAEQVWKSVRTNKRVSGCAEGPFLDVRAMLRRGEIPPAEKLLNDTTPTNAILYVEKLLVLAWIRATQKQYDAALKILDDVARLPYPAGALAEWRGLIGLRRDNTGFTAHVPVVLADLMRGHHARRDGHTDEALAAYRAVASSAAAQPFARYALATLGQDDPAALLASQPGLFLAVRCRALTALQKFRRRESSAAELLDALQHAAHAGYQRTRLSSISANSPRCCKTSSRRATTCSPSLTLIPPPKRPLRRNFFRASALEQAVRRLPPAEALTLLREWSRLDWLADAESLRTIVARQMNRLILLTHRDESNPPADTLADSERLQPGDALPALLRSLFAPGSTI